MIGRYAGAGWSRLSLWLASTVLAAAESACRRGGGVDDGHGGIRCRAAEPGDRLLLVPGGARACPTRRVTAGSIMLRDDDKLWPEEFN
ncbi:uncharacterized protein GGS25DRAFT_497305 [Hypoxylon fragiforme]|uniref:uncharacterized protein n=1 Tax=Hypoxylon fragiforme TaxID=63214 RepID=UPI0020C7225B|nr:uncharacterized protein GGS25DRAFT_497305 [Hypoxylon fragiforme]KAI2607761.1 hypothetical protein GGS25DRAFT_497305 [Hypoxylon fragiforme]